MQDEKPTTFNTSEVLFHSFNLIKNLISVKKSPA